MQNLNEQLKKSRQLKLAVGGTAFLAVIMIYLFLTNTAYYEAYQPYYILAALVGLGLFFLGLLIFRFFIIIPAVVIILLALGMSLMKFDWRKNYIEEAEAGNPFLFEEYIDRYPALEDYIYASYFGGPNWIGFHQICAEPANNDQPIPNVCSDLSRIKDEFGLDMRQIVEAHYQKMKRTARRIEAGQMQNKSRYEMCLQTKQCAVVPLLPPNVDPDQISGTDYSETRRAFWSLIEDDKLNEVVCSQMTLCRLLVKMKALNAATL